MRTILTPLLTVLLAVALLTAAAPPADAAGTSPARRLAAAQADRDDAVDRAETLATRLGRVTARLNEITSEAHLIGLRRAEVTHKLAAAEVRLSGSDGGEVFVTSFVSLIAQVVHDQLADEADDLAGRYGDLSGDRVELSDRRDHLAQRLQAARRQVRKATVRVKQLEQLRPQVRDHGSGMVEVGGIVVKAEIGRELARLLWHARADGHDLGGYGWRSPETTARLRIANGCPDVHHAPASSCRVPTARPGTSMHETGLAIDFTVDGGTLCFPRPGSSCDHPAYRWLVANAGAYGLRNLPSEAWHWSTTGG